MPKFIINTCGNTMEKTMNNSYLNSEYLYTVVYINLNTIVNMCVEVPFINFILRILSNLFSTTKSSQLYLLNKSFTHFPHSLLLEPLKRI